MLELIDVWKGASGEGRQTLAGANVVIPSGRKVALFGANPAANTTLTRLLSGLELPQRGVVRRKGVPCWPFDHAGFLDRKGTLKQNALFLARCFGVDADEVLHVAATLSGVRINAEKPLSAYTPTERRLLQMALTLSFQFDWYFINERLPPPFDNPAMEAALADRLDRASVVWATVSPKRVLSYCDAALVLDRGLLTFYNRFEDAVAVYDRLMKVGAGKTNAGKARGDQ